MIGMSAPYPIAPPPSGDPERDAKTMAAYRAEVARMNRPDWTALGAAFLVFAGVVGGIAFALDAIVPEYVRPPLSSGSVVSMKLDGRKGMVLSGWCVKESCSYLIRFVASNLQTDVSLLGEDGAVVSGAYHDVWVKDFEVKQ